LLVITNGYPNKDGSIPDSVFVKDQIDLLAKHFKEVNVVVIAPYLPRCLWFFFKQYKNRVNLVDYKYNNINVFYSKYFKLPNSVSYRTFNLYNSVVRKITKQKIDFDLIHAHFVYPSGYVASKIKKNYKKKLIITGHGFDVYDFPYRSKQNKKIFIDTLHAANFFITVSKKNLSIAKSFLNLDKKSIVIPNGFSNEFGLFSKITARKKLKLNLNKKIILHVGAYKINIKNQINLIRAISELLNTRKDFILYLIGSGKDEKKIRDKIKELKLDKYVKLIGSITHDKMPLWMSASDLFVFPSYSESFGIVQIEAMACGIPVIATINGGSEEIITDKEIGLLLEDPKDYKALANLINIGLNKKWDYKKIKTYAGNFSLKKIIKILLKTYEKI